MPKRSDTGRGQRVLAIGEPTWAPGKAVVGAEASSLRAPPCLCAGASFLTTALQDHWDTRRPLPSCSWPASHLLPFIMVPTYAFGVEEARTLSLLLPAAFPPERSETFRWIVNLFFVLFWFCSEIST